MVRFNPSGTQAVLSYESKDELRELVRMLKARGYAILHGLDDIKDDDHIVAVVVDVEKKNLHKTNVTVMACWCSQIGKPSTVKEFLNSYSDTDVL